MSHTDTERKDVKLQVLVNASQSEQPVSYNRWNDFAEYHKDEVDVRFVWYVKDLLKELVKPTDVLVVVDNRAADGARVVKVAREAGYKNTLIAVCWPGTIASCLKAGADEILTDHPLMMLEFLQKLVDRKKRQLSGMGSAYKFFLCHASSDHEFVAELASKLIYHGYRVWYDEWQFNIGDSILDKIQHGLEASSFLIVVLSPDSVRSKWVKEEINATLWTQIIKKSVRILPVLYKDCQLPPFLRDKYYADFRPGVDHGLRELLFRLPSETSQTR